MAKAKRLPSGSYRVRVFSHTTADGKNVYESFTAHSKAEAEMQAAQFAAKKRRRVRNDLTVGEAITQYINAKEAVLSPSTIFGYRKDLRTKYKAIQNLRVRKLTAAIIQEWVSGLSKEVSPKTVRNVYALFSSSMRFCDAEFSMKGISLPAIHKKRSYAPTDGEVAILYNAASDKMKLCIALAAFGSLRRGEICALKYGDINGNTVYVHSDIVLGTSGWIYKDYPKTSESTREVLLPDAVIELFGDGETDEFVFNLAPSGLSSAYDRLRKKTGVTIRFHDLRHYFASIGAILHIPDTYLAAFGGWKVDSPVMKNVYQNQITNISQGYAAKMVNHFDRVLSEYDTKYDTTSSESAV